MPIQPATRVRTIAFLNFFWAGGSVLVDCVRMLEEHRFSVDPTFLLYLWMGVCLLEYREAARTWALVIVWYMLVSGCIYLLATVLEIREMPYYVQGSLAGYVPRTWQFVFLVANVVFLAIVLWVLHHPETRRLFENPPQRAAWKVPTMLRVAAAICIVALPIVLVVRGINPCSEAAREAIYVDIRDSLTNEKIGTGATVAAGKEISDKGSITYSYSDGPWPAMVNGPGRYVVTVTKDGYRQWVKYRVLVKARKCELQRVDLTARLQRDPAHPSGVPNPRR